MMEKKTGILLVNLGTPSAPKPLAVFRYLIEFLTDWRVIDLPWIQRQLLVRGLIVPTRFLNSARSYQTIWTEEGSPLLVYGNRLKNDLQKHLGDDFLVELSMRYQFPSIKTGLGALLKHSLDELIILPLFPQYASATTGSVFSEVFACLKNEWTIPKLRFIDQFANFPPFIDAFIAASKTFDIPSYDHIVLSFHGLPERHLRKSDKWNQCLQSEGCCAKECFTNKFCYSAQCYQTAFAITEKLGISKDRYTISFQSRLGKDPWLTPSTSEILQGLAKKGAKKVLVFCPSFICDCLETIFEIGVEYKELFKHSGGEVLDLVPGLNDSPDLVSALSSLLKISKN